MRGGGPFAALAWIASCLFGALAMLVLAAQAFGLVASPLWGSFFVGGTLAGSALLLLPPLWRAATSRWLNIPRVILAIVLAYAGLLTLPAASTIVPMDSATRSGP
jgi:hypothetical protein